MLDVGASGAEDAELEAVVEPVWLAGGTVSVVMPEGMLSPTTLVPELELALEDGDEDEPDSELEPDEELALSVLVPVLDALALALELGAAEVVAEPDDAGEADELGEDADEELAAADAEDEEACDAVSEAGTAMAEVSLATGESKEPVMESRLLGSG